MNASIMKSVSEPETKIAMQQAKEQTMKKLSVMIALLGWSGIALGSPVGVYVDDSFTNPTLDSAVWDSSAGGVSIVSGQVKINNGWIQSKATVSPDLGETVIVNGKSVWCTNWTSNNQWGLSDASGNNKIVLAESSNWNLAITTGGTTKTCFVVGGDNMNYDWTINWTPSQVVVAKTVGAVTTVMFDSSVNAPIEGGGWTIPTAMMGILAQTQPLKDGLFFSNLSLEVVPEPASLALLGAAGLLLLRRRR